MKPTIYFIFNQKLVLLSKDLKKVLIAKRQGEADYNHTYTFIGGKLETSDDSFVAGMKREKDEEIGEGVVIEVIPNRPHIVLYCKKDGDRVVVAHFPAIYISGTIKLSDEYSDYKWVAIEKLDVFEPKVANIPDITRWAISTIKVSKDKFIKI
ncbi:MAG: NUDIX domain-containing protein [Candidatus Saccharimonadales bacterium]